MTDLRLIEKPEATEYAPYIGGYFATMPDDGRVLSLMQQYLVDTLALVRAIPAENLGTPFAEGEWTVKEILVHVLDDERIFAYRALRFGRNDPTDLPGFDQDAYVPASDANSRDIESILAELSATRQATIALFNNFDDDALLRQGNASGTPLSVRAAIYHIAGHHLHHHESIRENYT